MNKFIIYFFITILGLNIAALYWIINSVNRRLDTVMSRQSVIASTSGQLVGQEDENGNVIERNVTFVGPLQSCEDCPNRIESLEEELALIKDQFQTEVIVTKKPGAASVRELYVTLGIGTTSNKDWTDIPGASAFIDSNNYSGVSGVTFEGSIRVPQKVGRAYIRLYNKTGDHPVWFSEQSTESDTSYYFQSDSISLDPGNNNYQVQMKSTIGSEVNVDSARVKIVLQ